MTKHVIQRKTWKIGIFAVLSLALLVSSSCKSPSDPDIFANIIAQNLCGAAVDAVVYSDTIEITQSLNYIVVIEGPSYIVIENKYGESLDIYMNGTRIGSVADGGGRVITKVTFGTHNLAATRSVDGVVVEELTLEVEDVAEYLWTIIKPATD
jgi:hypothetical protein